MSDFQLAMAVLAGIVVIFVLAWLAQGRKPRSPLTMGQSKERIDIMDDRLSAIEGWAKSTTHDMSNVRAMLQALPSKDAVHKLEVDMVTLAGKLEVINTVSVATGRAVDRIENHLMSQGTKSTS